MTDVASAIWRLSTLPKLLPWPKSYAVLGFPIAHSLSPAIHQAAFAAIGWPGGYGRVEVDTAELEPVVHRLKTIGFSGWNCTAPLKQEMFRLCDRRATTAIRLGAVNTVVHRKGTLEGHNTDGKGWVLAVEEAFSVALPQLRILFLGLGGAGAAVARQASWEGCPLLRLANRTASRSLSLAEEIKVRSRVDVVPWEEAALLRAASDVDLLVSCLTEDPLFLKDRDFLDRLLRPNLFVFDLRYWPPTLPLLEAARERGAHASNGLGMLLHQAALAFELWTGNAPPLPVMRKALFASLSSRDAEGDSS
ncbi:shikimate dehydrogenase [Methylacidimicrobium cyclopophantes]|uniref:Shikimate dehydrogenase (NADP(+)) n=1 Tax=Methylacidimicrobium cyclopophantes TaxID=1041766 RepID=A0A5E6M7R8_9BACT|nr:shikimate dehydrogenase [Methylacidimicrobium cyclopophantes]VVM05413.1 shikimate dehydrogenase [Methylacidimicrobium cyclopophantes]